MRQYFLKISSSNQDSKRGIYHSSHPSAKSIFKYFYINEFTLLAEPKFLFLQQYSF
ncbi:hypothetical protein TTHERM_000219108 (macronuclear) [Tetrahymena thermophila SB210]|uniref:Uncharacterized protein n=1 Tax=Tetrahymena thermophila (strain SB210) TaxID=312017 RepID=W7XGL3_TETTS|nr:hypothetical protein TTHERM_000219108 [Tetrahymena thermophila SB210]EWS73286.1 hypothetical protein TTHERM_000219108 [Tetrahymena thermophila SB210]|eukprot:XP_012654195.1 hypothetical protein TTHERM_000219108 [Tetrahymena thermophila SB210]